MEDLNKKAVDAVNDTAKESAEKLSGVARELDGEKTKNVREAMKKDADDSNPYPHKLRD